MPKNFLILFTAREGSTAIVATLSNLKYFQVPLLEEFDKFWVDKHYRPEFDVPVFFDETFKTGTLELENMWGRKNYIYYDRSKPERVGRDRLSVGFKWRAHGKLRDTIDVLKKHDVTVFYLVRRDFRELVSSLYLSNTKVDGKTLGHAQFKVANASAAEREHLLQRFNSLEVKANPWTIGAISAKRVIHAFRNTRVITRCKRAGLETQVLYYEDFTADPDGFFAKLVEDLGNTLEPDENAQVLKSLKKVNKSAAKDRIHGSDQGLSNAAIGVCGFLYNRILASAS